MSAPDARCSGRMMVPRVDAFTSLLNDIGPVASQYEGASVYFLNKASGEALKKIQIDKLNGAAVEMLEAALRRFTLLRHPNILKAVRSFRRDNFLYLHTVRYDHSLKASIAENIQRKKIMPCGAILEVARQIASALMYLHDPNKKGVYGCPIAAIVHGGVKPANILTNKEETQFLLSDVGIASSCPGDALTYAAPEVLRGDPPTIASDMWSLGMVLYELATGNTPVAITPKQSLANILVHDWQPQLTLIKSGHVAKVIQMLLVLDPKDRISAAGLVTLLDPDGPFCNTRVEVDNENVEEYETTKPLVDLGTMLYEAEDDAIEDNDNTAQQSLMLEHQDTLAQTQASFNSASFIGSAIFDGSGVASYTISQVQHVQNASKVVQQSKKKKKGKQNQYNVKGKTASNMTPLMIAARNGNTNTVAKFVEEGFYLGARTGTGTTALMFAAQAGHLEAAQLLFEHENCMTNRAKWTALMFAAQKGTVEIVELLVEAEHGRRNNGGWTALMCAAENDNAEAVKVLKKYEAGMMNNHGETALIRAAYGRNRNVVKILFNCEKNASKWTLLMYAATLGNIVLVTKQLDQCKKVDRCGATALMWAARNGHIKIVKILVKREVGMTDKWHKKALFYAEDAKQRGVVQFLERYHDELDLNSGEDLEYSSRSDLDNVYY